MQTCTQVPALRAQLAAWREDGHEVALVPTMGNLHEGHLRLVKRARELAERTVVSIFVNPTQFVVGEDFDAYPRTPEADRLKLSEAGVDLLFMPPVDELYSNGGLEATTRVQVPALDGILCGASRPGHFTGVATIVSKLFNLVQPDYAVFGDKDYQQLLVIRRLVRDLCFPIDIVGVPTVRDRDGLALSSRNGYLSAEERAAAPKLYAALKALVDKVVGGAGDYAALEAEASQAFAAAGMRTDYVSLRRATDLALPSPQDKHLVVLAAAFLGRARLIDHIEFKRP